MSLVRTARILTLACVGLLALGGCASPSATARGGQEPPARPSAAAAPTPAPRDDLAALSDEFDTAASLGQWRNYATVEGWPNLIETLDVKHPRLKRVGLCLSPKAGHHRPSDSRPDCGY